MGAVLALSFVREGLGPATLLAIPFLSFGMTYLVETHHSMIGELSKYLATDWPADMSKLQGPVVQWDGSPSNQNAQGRAIRERSLAHALILLSPPVLILVLYASDLDLDGGRLAWEWLLGVTAVVMTGGLLVRSHRARHRAAADVAALGTRHPDLG